MTVSRNTEATTGPGRACKQSAASGHDVVKEFLMKRNTI